MGQVQWDNSLSVGVQLIDDQHKMLIKRINSLSEAIACRQGSSEITRTLGFLIEYTSFHFSTEEKHMVENSYPGFEDHKKKHEEFKVTLNNLEEDFLEEGATHALADSIDTFMGNWLIKHIHAVDVAFGKFLLEKGVVLTEENPEGGQA